jgi:hypothetical protein
VYPYDPHALAATRIVGDVPIAYRADRTLGCTVVVWHGTVTSREMDRQLRHLATDPDWPAGPRHLIDASTIGTVTVPDPELLELLYDGVDLARELRVAIVLAPGFLDVVGMQYRTTTHDFHAAIFVDRDQACTYLGLDSMAVETVINELRRGLETSRGGSAQPIYRTAEDSFKDDAASGA